MEACPLAILVYFSDSMSVIHVSHLQTCGSGCLTDMTVQDRRASAQVSNYAMSVEFILKET